MWRDARISSDMGIILWEKIDLFYFLFSVSSFLRAVNVLASVFNQRLLNSRSLSGARWFRFPVGMLEEKNET